MFFDFRRGDIIIPLIPQNYYKLTFRKLNQRISACVQGTPRRGNEHIAQGNRRRSERIAELAPAIPSEEEEDEVSALGMMKR